MSGYLGFRGLSYSCTDPRGALRSSVPTGRLFFAAALNPQNPSTLEGGQQPEICARFWRLGSLARIFREFSIPVLSYIETIKDP